MSCILIKLCAVEELAEGQSKGFKVADQSILVVKKYGDIHVYENRCPHLGIQMEMVPDQFLDSSRSLIICAMHGALFRIEDGQCVSGPCLSDKLTAITFEISDGCIYMNEDKAE
jgi:nitrite reductase/ring-hydroxylating ferredoxin subunit